MSIDDTKTLSMSLLRDRALVEYETPDEESRGGIWMPESAREDFRYTAAVVRAVGPGRLLDDGTRLPVGVNVGDRVLCMDKRLHEGVGDSGRLAIVQEGAIIGVLLPLPEASN